MKRKLLLLILLTSLALTGCGSKIDADIPIHEDIRKEVAEDSYEIMKMVEAKVNEDENIDMDAIESYKGKYTVDGGAYTYKGKDNLTWGEENLILMTVMLTNTGTGEDGIEESFNNEQKRWYDTLKTGELNLN